MDLMPIGGLSKVIRQRRIAKFQTLILEHGKKAGGPFYIDEVDFDSLLSGNQEEEGKSPNMIGIATRILIGKRAIVRTGKYRNSTREGSNRRLIFQYTLARGVVDQEWVVREDGVNVNKFEKSYGRKVYGLFQGSSPTPIVRMLDDSLELLQTVADAHNATLPQEDES